MDIKTILTNNIDIKHIGTLKVFPSNRDGKKV